MASILLVEDDDAVATLITATLRGLGHTVTRTGDGHQALRLLADTQPDIVLTDVVMPDMDGLELIRQLRAQGSGIRIVATSGGGLIGSSTYLDLAARLGADAVLRKPFALGELLTALGLATNAG